MNTQNTLRRQCSWLCGFILLLIPLLANADAWGHVKRVIDGDTVELENGDRLRLLGINAPEWGRGNRVEQPGARSAYRWLRDAAQGRRIRVLHDVERRDAYQRTLGYLFDAQGRHLNLQLVRRGLATLSPHPPNLRFQFELFDAQQEARRQRLGIWGNPYYAPKSIVELGPESVGNWGRYQGQVERVEILRTGTRLWFNGTSYVWVPARYASYFGRLEVYEGQRLEVMAWPKKYDQYWSLFIRHPSQLQRINAGLRQFSSGPFQTAPVH